MVTMPKLRRALLLSSAIALAGAGLVPLLASDPALQGRGQANNETFIAQDRYRPDHLVASDNDYVRGDGTCGAAYSFDRGRSWHDSTVPNGFTRGDLFGGSARQYWQAGGDT